MSNRKPGWPRKTRSLGTTGSLRRSSLVAFTAPSRAVSAVTTPSDSQSRPIRASTRITNTQTTITLGSRAGASKVRLRSACSGLGKFEASSTTVTSHAHSTVIARVPTIVTTTGPERRLTGSLLGRVGVRAGVQSDSGVDSSATPLRKPDIPAAYVGQTRAPDHDHGVFRHFLAESQRVADSGRHQHARRHEGARGMQFGRSYEEFEVGATYKHWPGKTVTEFDDHMFCLLTMNHHPLHLDANYAEETTQFGKNVVVGNYVYSILLGMSVPDISGKAIANLEIESLRHVAPTFHGDTLYGETTRARQVGEQEQGRPGRRPRRDHRLQPGRQGRLHLPPQGDGAQGQLPRARAAASSPAARSRSRTRTGPGPRPSDRR